MPIALTTRDARYLAALRRPARRDAYRLALTLRYARQQALGAGGGSTIDPPELTVPGRSLLLFALWLATTPLSAAAIVAVTTY